MFLLASKIPARAAALPLETSEGAGNPLQLADFQPHSMLHVPETKVARSRYPVIDIYTHLPFAAKSANGLGIGEAMKYLTTPDAALPLMDRKNIRIMVNLTGGVRKGLDETIDKVQKPHPDRSLFSRNHGGSAQISRDTASFKPMRSVALTRRARAD